MALNNKKWSVFILVKIKEINFLPNLKPKNVGIKTNKIRNTLAWYLRLSYDSKMRTINIRLFPLGRFLTE